MTVIIILRVIRRRIIRRMRDIAAAITGMNIMVIVHPRAADTIVTTIGDSLLWRATIPPSR